MPRRFGFVVGMHFHLGIAARTRNQSTDKSAARIPQRRRCKLSLLFVASIPEDPGFAQLHSRSDKYYTGVWNSSFCKLLYGALYR
mmetsp:Transcript_5515/g.15549  ORF Transcript_5515/g.15549 Transcript_5515/m.15549 type:complete len:85 (-) Transcript_5515:122-376(-)